MATIKFGMHKGKAFINIPDDYLKWLINQGSLKGKLLAHCNVRFNLPKTKYRVTVTDSIGCDGIYFVKAWDKKQAISICRNKYKIQCSQSEHGTNFLVEITKI